MDSQILAVMTISFSGGLALPLLVSVLLHAGLFEMLLAIDAGGLDRKCFFGGLIAGLAPLSIILIAGFGSVKAAIGSVLGMFGYSAAILDLDGTREGCLYP